ncbi:P-II family nitrogen regulator [Marinisporobacter balticus]|uniref:Nitrogen regulatory protein P-II n=1 Tax=Marinisporobacter balticus TaxID=2018667 RepID=A0A4R2KT34_9FIRM|nr:P-II family nitrogen regulator [Marinisporobacter balticus]TCO76954.1 nitrogen regulatory protein P-II [Marinisporobacter balticus]
MYALFLILNEIEKLDQIHNIFYDMGVGATTIDSVGMGKVLLEHNINVPIFSSIRKLVDGNKPYNKTIVSVIRSEEKLRKVVDLINEELDHIHKPGVGFMFVLPVLECYGSKHNGSEINKVVKG